jgi:hypothetical protein
MQNKLLLEKIAFYTLFFLPFFVFFLIFQRFALNVPFEDDFGILRNIYDMGVSDDFKVQFRNAISTSNEHPIIISKLFFGLNIWLFKSINFKALMFIGNAIFLSSFVVFFRLLKQHRLSLWILLPLPYILLSGSTFESGLWAICSFQYNAICGFFIWAIYLIFPNKANPKKIYLGLFLLVCTLVCNGNGILAFLLIGMGLLYQKRWKELGVTVALLLILKFFLLTNSYYKTPNPALTALSSFCILVGGSLKTDSLNGIIQLIGGLIIGFIALASLNYIIRRKQHTLEFNILLLALFSLGSLLGIALFREISSSMFADRYRLYPQFLLICVYFLLVIFLSNKAKQLSFVASIFGVLYFVHTFYVTYPSILSGYQKRQLLSVNWKTNGSALNGSFYRLFFDETLHFYEKNKLYSFQKPIFDIKTAKISNKSFEVLAENVKNGNIIRVKNIDCSKISKDNGYYVVLENAKHQFYFLPVLYTRSSLKAILKGQAFFINELAAPIVYAEIPADTYSIGLLSDIDSSPTFFKTGISISTHQVDYQQ